MKYALYQNNAWRVREVLEGQSLCGSGMQLTRQVGEAPDDFRARCIASGIWTDILKPLADDPELSAGERYTAISDLGDGTVGRSVEPIGMLEGVADGKATVKALRDEILRSYSDKLVIYHANYEAARAIADGNGATFTMNNGDTAAEFGTDAAAAMGLADAGTWATYIIGEWTTLGTLVEAMELDYLRLTYNPTLGLDAMATSADVATAVATFVSTYGG